MQIQMLIGWRDEQCSHVCPDEQTLPDRDNGGQQVPPSNGQHEPVISMNGPVKDWLLQDSPSVLLASIDHTKAVTYPPTPSVQKPQSSG